MADVAPLVTYLCHDNCTDNGSVFETAGGWSAKGERFSGFQLFTVNTLLPQFAKLMHHLFPAFDSLSLWLKALSNFCNNIIVIPGCSATSARRGRGLETPLHCGG